MRRFGIVFVWSVAWVILVAGVGYFFYFEKLPCQTPIGYKIGTLDPRFGVTQSQFLQDINQASTIWGSAIDKKLFVYDPNGSLTINLVYDTRQAATQEAQTLTTAIDQTTNVADSVKQQYSALEQNYQTAQAAYNTQLAQLTQAQSAYNSSVDYWNKKGGAPAAQYATLQTQKSTLVDQQNALEAQRQQANNLATQINALIDKYNLLVDHINTNVSAINNDGLTGSEFEEGVYISDAQGTRINIYQFDNQTYFIRVLAHELGHALQLQHNSNPDSIMNPVNQSQSLVLSSQDLAELKTECRI
jgi:hypothetical protein